VDAKAPNNLTDLMSADDAIKLAVGRINEALGLYKVKYWSVGLSGGHDSVTVAGIAARHPDFRSALHIHTGVGIAETQQYVRDLCAGQGWKLEIYSALEHTKADGTPAPQDYFAWIEEQGFPGPPLHWKMYSRLKERQIERWKRDHKERRLDRLALVTGRRKQESHRRWKSVTGPHEWYRRLAWVNPVYDFSKLDCIRVMEHLGLPRSPVVDKIHKSGECLCGAFAAPGELKELRFWYPNDPTVQRLAGANERLSIKFGWGWEGRPMKNGRSPKQAGPMCSSCNDLFAK
jgi:3'-phosphoadenosine 5'-phosphosulfate sulfotransferase (PAPS reductase)/FAD synthetase